MKKLLLPIIFFATSATVFAQQDFFALAGKDSQRIEFNDFRAMNAEGNSVKIIFDVNANAQVFSQSAKSRITENKNAYNNSQAMNIAALAYDVKNDHLVYMPMFSSNVYVLNQKTNGITLVENNVARVSSCDINSHITRMTAGYDGSMYALNNAGTQLLKISERNQQYSVVDLGIVKDDPSNGKNSFTAMETGFGGDMVADADNNFYVFSASGNVFKVLVKDLQAKFIGKINGLPESYTVNGAAVNSNGNVVIANAKGASMYEINLSDLSAKQLSGEKNLHVYDLASRYFVNDRKAVVQNLANIDIYPSKVEDRTINISINDNSVKGNINVQIFDVSRKTVQSFRTAVRNGNLKEQFNLQNVVAGNYVVTIVSESGKQLFSKKIIVTK